MKTFDEYKDGDWVFYLNNYHDPDYRFQAYKSKYTHNAFRLKNSKGERVADISEISPIWGNINENSTTDLQSGFRSSRGTVDSDADSSGIYHIYDDHQD